MHCLCFDVLGDQSRDPLDPPVPPVPLLLPEIDLWCQGIVAERRSLVTLFPSGNFSYLINLVTSGESVTCVLLVPPGSRQ